MATGISSGVYSKTILLVDDQVSIREYIKRILEPWSFFILESGDGEEALSLSESYPLAIDLLLTDVMMPVMNGKELADRLCAIRPNLRVLFISGYPRSKIFPRDICPDEAVDLICKPFSPEALINKVKSVLEGPL